MKVLRNTLFMLLVAQAAVAGLNDTTTISFSPSLVTIARDSIFTVAVTIDSVTNLFSVATDINFDANSVQVISIKEGTFLNSNGTVSTSLNQQVNPGTIILGLSRLGSSNGGVSTPIPKTLFSIQFKKKSVDTTFLTLSNTGLIRPDGITTIPLKTKNCTVRGFSNDPLFAHMTFSPASIFSYKDSTFSIAMNIDSANGLFAYATEVNYNASLIRFITATEGNVMNSGGTVSTSFTFKADTVNGKITIGHTRLGVNNGTINISASVPVCSLSFKKLSVDTANVFFTNTGLIKSDGITQIPVQVSSGRIISNGAPFYTSVQSVLFSDAAKNDSTSGSIIFYNLSFVNPLTITAMTFNNSQFYTQQALPFIVPINGNSTLTLYFKPSVFGTYPDTLTCVSSIGVIKFPLLGNSPTPTISLSSSSLDFGTVSRSTTSVQTIKITTSTVNRLSLDSIYTASSKFIVTPKNGSLAKTDTAVLTITYYPSGVGLRLDTLSIRNNSATTLNKIPLKATNPATASPLNLVITDSSNQTLTIKWRKNAEMDFLRYRIYRGNSPTPTTLVDSTVGGNSSDTSRTYSGLTNNKTYYFRLTAVDSSYNASAYSNEVHAQPNVPPSAPQLLTVVKGDGQATLKWNKNIESDFLRYRIYRGTSPSPTLKVDSSSASITDTTKLVMNLVNGITYYFRITAVDSAGLESSFSNEVNVKPDGPPLIPQSLTVISGDGQVTLRWRQSSDFNFKCYRIYKGTASPAGTLVDSTTAGISDTTRTIINLVNGTWYFFRVTAIDSARYESGYSNEVYIRPDGPPTIPQNLTAISGNGQVTLKWQHSNDFNFLRYRIYRGTSPVSLFKIDSTTAGPTDTTRVESPLVNNITYYFQVTAVDSAGNESGNSNQVSVTPNAPPATPVNLVATPSGLGQITLRWSNNSEADFLKYRIYLGVDSTTVNLKDSTNALITETTKIISGLTNGTKYYFRITALDSGRLESPKSFAAYATTMGNSAIAATTPSANTVNVLQATSMTVSFYNAIDQSTLTNSTIKVIGSLSGLHTSTFSYTSGTKTATITPNTAFKPGDVVRVTLTRGIKSAVGDSLLSTFAWSFVVKASTNSSGQFTQSSIPSVGSNPWSVTAGDFNGDSYLDLAVTNYGSNTVSILLNNGSGSFTQSSTPSVGSSPRSVTTGDFNGDGYLDLAVTNYGSNTVSILSNNGSGVFTQSSTPSVGSNPWSVTAGDFNGDGYLDLAIVNYGSNTVSILLNNGSGVFTQSSTPGVGSNPISITSGDFNGDGYLDLAVANSGSASVSILLNNGSGVFTQSSTPGVGSGPYSVTSGDFNGDGFLDLAVANASSNTVSILLNNGSGGFTQSSTPSVGSSPNSVTLGDFNGDGYLDLAVTNLNSNSVSILLNNGSGVFTQSSTPSVGSSPYYITAGDFNGDGVLDLGVTNYSSNTVSILRNRLRTVVITLPVTAINYSTVVVGSNKSIYVKIRNDATDSTLTISNITNSNTVFTLNKTSLSIPPAGTDSVQVTFTPTRIIAYSDSLTITSNDPFNPTVKAYLTGSGNAIASVIPQANKVNVQTTSSILVTFAVDMNAATLTNNTIKVIGSLSGPHTSTFSYTSGTKTATITPNTAFKPGDVVTVTLYRGIKSTTGDSLIGTFAWNFIVKASAGCSGQFTQSSTPGVGNYPRSVTAGDFNGDGYLDLAVANYNSSTVSILLNNGSGVFTQSSTPSVGSQPYSVTAGDFNGDGYIDLAVANYYSNTVSILLNNGSGVFTQSSTPGVGSYPISVTTGDFNGDGYLDLAVANWNSNTVSILLNNGSGVFTQSSTPGVGSGPYSVTTGDFNGDGYLDLAVANYYSNTVSILLNNGSGVFTQSSAPGVGSYPRSVIAGDFNGDGYIDLAVANSSSSTVSILLNNGSGIFTQSSTPSVGSSPYSITAGDFNGDGYLDLAVANYSSSTVSILLNNGSGVFTQSSTPTVGSNPCSVTAGDFNGDGYLDLAAANYNSNSTSILQNRSRSASIVVSSYSIAFGSVSVGSNKSISLKITNIGTDSSLVISNISNSNSVFTLNKTSLTIPPSGTDSVQVTFTPNTNASFGDTIKVTSNDSRNPISTVSLSGFSGNSISGVITSNTTWTKANSPYIISGITSIDVGVTLTIQSGTQVVFNGSYAFNVDGTLQATGVLGDSVVIMGITSGIVYPGLTFRSGGNGSFAYVKIQNASAGITTQSGSSVNIQNSRLTGNTVGLALGYISASVKTLKFDNNGTGIQTSNSAQLTADSLIVQSNTLGVGCGNSTTTITNSSISNNAGYGISDGGSGGSLTLNNCQINSNTSNGVYCSSSSPVNVTNSRLIGNGSTAIYVGYNYANGSISGDSIRSNGSGILSYSYYNTISNNIVTLNTGIGIQSWSNNSITNNTVMGNGSTGINFSGSGNITGNIVSSNTGVGIQTTTSNAISYNKINNNSSHGMVLTGTPAITYNDILNNNGDGVQVSNKPSLSYNRIYGNTGFALNATLQAQDSIIARYNYWSLATDSTISSVIHDYYDDGVTVKVFYKPYFTKSIFPPQNLAASSSVGQMKLNWLKGNPPSNFMRYRIYGGLSSSPTVKMDSTNNLSDTIRVLTGLSPGTTYYFRMTAIDSTGLESDYSNEVNCVQLPMVQIYAVTPNSNQNNVPANTQITVQFGFDVNTGTLTNSTIKVIGSLSGPHTSTFSYTSGTKTATITPNTVFKSGDVVTVILKRGIKSTAGDSLTSAFAWNFMIKATAGSSGKFTQSSTPGVGSSPYSVTAGDFNGDGYLDLAVANYYSYTVSILLNNGNGVFTQSSIPGVGSNPWSVTAGDFNGDGFLDLAVANQNSNTVSILLNNGSGVFTQSSTPSVGTSPYSITAGDFNGDGYLDLAVANYNSNTVSILLNNGSGVFTQSSTPGVGSGPYSVTTGDFNGDGYIDLAVANYYSYTVSILLNNGSGVFTQSSTPGVGSYPRSVIAGDFNGDGYIDLAVANSSSSTVSILLNNGSGVFTQSSTPSVGTSPYSITTGDFNGDGYLDLAVANYSSSTVSILLNNGNGVFTQSSTPGVGSNPHSVTAGDFNGDGYLDLAAANYNSNTVSILLNHSIKAKVLLSTSSINFGIIAKNASSGSYFKISNDASDSSLVLSNLSVTNSVFTLNKTSLTIPPLSIDSVLVTFTPTAVLNYKDSLSFTANDPTTPIVKVGLNGTGAAVPVAPTLINPASNTINQPIAQTFKWNQSIGASTYRIMIATDSTFATGIVLNDSTNTDTTRAVSGLANSTKYYWRINAKNFLGTSAYSTIWNFTTIIAAPPVPTLVTPATGASNQPLSLTLKWNSVVRASTYRVQVSMDSTFASNIIVHDSTMTDTTKAISGLYNSVTYYWRVRAQNIGGSSSYTSFWKFTTVFALPPVPTLAFPGNNTINQPVAFSLKWNKSIGSSTYRVQVGSDSNFVTGIVLNDSTVTDTTRAIGSLNYSSVYYWRVNAKNVVGTSVYSSIWHFTTVIQPPPVPVLASPLNGALNQPTSLALQWYPAIRAAFYWVQVATDSNFVSGILVNDTSVTDTTKFISGLATASTYYWRVLASNLGGTSAYSPRWKFGIVPPVPSAPQLSSPVNNSLNQPIAFIAQWRKSQYASSYRIQVATDSNFLSGIFLNDSTLTDTARAISGLSNSTTYYWRVNAKNLMGTSSYSMTWNFTTIIDFPAVPTLASPISGITNQPLSLTLKWNPAVRAATYRVQVAMDSTFIRDVVLNDSTVTDTTKAISGLYNSVTYYWRVRAQNVGGSSNYSNFWRFTTIMALPPVPTLVTPPNNAINQPITFSLKWNRSIGSASYRTQLSTDSLFTTGIIVNDSTITDTTRALAGLNYVTTYYWRVNAKNSFGTSAYSPIWNFKTQKRPPAAPQNLTATSGNAQVTLKWSKNTEADFLKYRIYIGADSTTLALKDSSTASILDTTKVIIGLTNNIKYYFRITALDSTRTESGYSYAVNSTPNGPPAAPQNLTAVSGNGQVTLKWRKNTEIDFMKYRIYMGNDSTTLALKDSSTASILDTTKVILGLINNRKYFFRITAMDSARFESGYSYAGYSIPNAPPAAPKSLAASSGNTQVTLLWRKNSEIDFYKYRIYIGFDSTTLILNDSSTASILDTTKIISGLRNNIKYYFMITAIDSARLESGYSNIVNSTPNAPPAAPRNLTAVSDSCRATLKWNKNTEPDFLRYLIFFGSDTTTPTLKDSSTASILDTMKVIIGLTNNRRYYFRIKALDSLRMESGFSYPVFSAPNAPPVAPQGLTAIAGDGRVMLKWNKNSDADFFRYRIYRSTSIGTEVKVDSTIWGGAADTAQWETGLTNSIKYYFYITAVDSTGLESISSNEVSVIALKKPSIPSATAGIGSVLYSTSVPIVYSINVCPLDTVKVECFYKFASDTNWRRTLNLKGQISTIVKSGSDTIYWDWVKELPITESLTGMILVPVGFTGRGDSMGTNIITLDNKIPRFNGISQAATNDLLLGKVVLRWNKGTDLSSPLTYRICYSDSSNGMNYSIFKDSTQDTSWVSKCLSQNKTYSFNVRGADKAGNVDTNTIVLTAKLPMLSDFNGDGYINAVDLLTFKNAWLTNDTLCGDIGPALGSPPNWQSARDHKVDFEDVMVLAMGWKWSVENPTAPLSLHKQMRANAVFKNIFDIREPVIIKQNEKKSFLLKIKNEKELAGIDFTMNYDTSKIILDSITSINDNKLLFFKNVNNKTGTASVSIISISDSLTTYVNNPEFLKVWITAKQKLVDEKISLEAQTYDYRANLMNETEQQLSFNWRTLIPLEYSLSQNYPNPFNPSTIIEYQLPNDAKISVKIYNILGQEITTLVDRDMKAGYYSLRWDAHNVATGVYFYRLRTKDFVQTKKMLLLR